MSGQPSPTTARRATSSIILRGLVALGLLVDAIVHLHLASGYQEASPDGVGLGNLFRLEAVVAIAATVYVLVRGTRRAHALAFVVAFTALLAVLASRYVDLPPLGPLPASYEPVWFPEKAISAVAEALAAVAAVAAAIALTRNELGRRSSGRHRAEGHPEVRSSR